MLISSIASCVVFQLFLIDIASSISVHVNYTNNDVIDSPLPDDVNVTVTINDTTPVLLQLKRVHYVGLDTPVYTITTDKDGRLVRSREVLDSSENIGFYQDINNHASFEIERINSFAENEFHFTVRGEFVHAGQKYSLSPSTRVERDLTSQEDQYDLQLEKLPSHFQMDSLFPENPDGWPYDTLSPKLQARRRRQAKADFYIDVTAMLDFMCWRRFLSKAAGSRPNAINNVLEYYAYIFNGVDLLFKSITSAGFKLNIRLTKIVICETAQSSPFTSRATTLAENYIDAYFTIYTLTSFIDIYGPNYLAPFEHVMLFVGCNLTVPDRSEDLLGLAYVGSACRTNGESSSVIEDMGDYRCIITAAHELGH
ncbi:uncharacterized protein LOC131933887, partial [Physella acuta]|uniref:uncharacterized protein LOC131933887 n=1 Tax=Physella acuta TaxID=109671 RepID=UPI0027DDFED4